MFKRVFSFLNKVNKTTFSKKNSAFKNINIKLSLVLFIWCNLLLAPYTNQNIILSGDIQIVLHKLKIYL